MNHLFPLLAVLFSCIWFPFRFIFVCCWVMDAKLFCFKYNETDEPWRDAEVVTVRLADFNYLGPIT
jgi:hypothetical protein